MPPESPRIAELRRRVHADPASIAFAQLAEEYRRAGNYEEAITYCRSGLARHPGYLSARVTLGRALSEIGQIDQAADEFTVVLKSAPDNLAAIRGMAEIHQRRGDLVAALEFYKRALTLARFDTDLEETVARIGREMRAVTAAASPEPHTSGGGSTHAPQTLNAEQATQTRSAPPTDLIDFDALLASLGVPDASPPPMVQMLVPQPAPAKPQEPERVAVSADAPLAEQPSQEISTAPMLDAPFADLEREFRAFAATPQEAPPVVPPARDDSMAVVLAELESWITVLGHESGDRRSSESAANA